MRRTCLARGLWMGLAMLLAAGCMAWPASKPKLKVVRVRKVPPIGPPVWRVDLRAFGYADRVDQLWKTPDGTTFTSALGGVRFVDQRTVIVDFVRRVPGKMASRDQLQETSPLRLQAVFFQADNGQVVAQRNWGMSSPEARVVTTYNGKFVLLLEQKLLLYSSALELLKELELRTSDKQSTVGTLVGRSPSGRTFLLIHRQGGQFEYQVLDAETLSSRESWSAPAMQFPTVADDKLAVNFVGEEPRPLPVTGQLIGDNYVGEGRGFVWGNVAVRRLGGAWTVACKSSNCGLPHFVNNDVLALDTIVGLRFIRVDGEPLSPEFRIREFGSGQSATSSSDYYSACALGDRFAVQLFSPSNDVRLGGGRDLHNLWRILVFDLPSGQWIATLEARQHKIKRICDAALSPDGTLLALFRQEGIVEVYPLPATTPAAPAAPQAK